MNGTRGGPLHVSGRKEGGAKDGSRRPSYKEEGTDLLDPEVGMQGEEQVWMKKRSDGLKRESSMLKFRAEGMKTGDRARKETGAPEVNGCDRVTWMLVCDGRLYGRA